MIEPTDNERQADEPFRGKEPQYLDTVVSGYAQVHRDDVGAPCLEGTLKAGNGEGADRLASAFLGGMRKQPADHRVIIDQQQRAPSRKFGFLNSEHQFS